MNRTRAFALSSITVLASILSAGALFGEPKTTRLTIISTTDGIGEISPCG